MVPKIIHYCWFGCGERPVVITSYAIAALLCEPGRMRRLSENCKTRDYTNSAEVEKIYALMED